MIVELLSVVDRGANRQTFFRKTDADVIAALTQTIDDLRAGIQRNDQALRAVADLSRRMNKKAATVDGREWSDMDDVRKAVETEYDVRQELKVRTVRARLAAEHVGLQKSWDHGDTEAERRHLLKIDELETELLALRHDVRPQAHDVFRETAGSPSASMPTPACACSMTRWVFVAPGKSRKPPKKPSFFRR